MRTARILAMLSAAAQCPTPALAQDPAAVSGVEEATQRNRGASTLEEVVVTATRRSESVTKVPYNITATTEQQLQDAGVTDFRQLVQLVPGLVYNGGGIREGGQNGFILRGLNTEDTSQSDLPSQTVAPVSMYIDDTPVFANVHIADIARVEVLRGPQGTLYGSGSLGGTVRFIYNPPDPSAFAARVQAEGSQTAHAGGANRSFDGMVNIPLASSLALRASAGHTFEHGFIDATNLFVLDDTGAPVLATPDNPIASLPVTTSNKDIDDSQLTYAHAAAKYEEGPFKITLSFHYQEERADGVSADTRGTGTLPTAFSPDVSPGFLNPGFDAAIPPNYAGHQTGAFLREPYRRQLELGNIEISRDLDFATLTSSTSYYDNQGRAVVDLSGSYQVNLSEFYLGFPRLAVASQRNTGERAFTEEVRLISRGEGRVDWVVGFYYQDLKQSFDNIDTIPGFAVFGSALFELPITEERAFDYRRRTEFRDMALFAELTVKLTDRWRITGGLRGFDQKLDNSTATMLPICSFPPCDSAPEITVGRSHNVTRRLLGKLGTSLQITDGLLGYFTYSEGFRRGGANALPTSGDYAPNVELLTFEPDTVRNYELGVKGTIGATAQVTVDVFQVDWNKPQLNILTPAGAFYAAVNGDEARSRGAELAMSGRLASDLTASASYSYTDAKLTSAFDVQGVSFGDKGERLPGVPEHQMKLGLDYSRPITSSYTFISHVDGSYRSGVSTQLQAESGSASVGSFWMWNASVGVRSDAWRAELIVDNVLDARGVTTAVPVSSVGPRHAIDRLTRPRTAGIRVSYDFR